MYVYIYMLICYKHHFRHLEKQLTQKTFTKTVKTITCKGSNVFPIIVKHANHGEAMNFWEGFWEAFSSPSVGERKRFGSFKSFDFPVSSHTFGCLLGPW